MKRRTKRLLTFILTFVIFLMSVNFSLAAEIVKPSFGIIEPTLYNSTQTNINLENYFDIVEFKNYLVEQLKLVDGDSSTIAEIDIEHFSIPASNDMVVALRELIWYNSPELFRFAGIGMDAKSNVLCTIKFYSYCTKEQYIKMLAEMQASAEKLLTNIKGNNNLSDVEKALILHDRLALLCEYDYDNLQNNSMPYTSYNAYGVLVLNDAVCQGYALAYDYLLEQVGIKADYCCSDTLNHAWNIVYINNTPYHVDVTWDDPAWDLSGRVRHVNFLRSTEGIKATGHNATDFTTTPSDTTYDNYYWQNYDTAFQLIDNEIFCFDSQKEELSKLNNISTGESTPIKEIKDTWTTDFGGFWGGSFTKLASDYQLLYYNTKDTVYSYDPKTGTEEIVFKPDVKSFGSGYWIYGMNYSDCKIICEIYNTPNFTEEVKKSYTVTTARHSSSDWVTTKQPTTEQNGEKQKFCQNCGIILEKQIIEKLSAALITVLENTYLDEENNVIFSNINICEDLETICKLQENTTYEISPSITFTDSCLLGTGSIVTLYQNNEKFAEYKIIINGDLNGDSVCDVLDVALAETCIYNKTPSADECYAANGSFSTNIDIDSLQKVVNEALN